MSQVPEPWATAMIEVGFTDPRYDDPRPSMSRLAEAAGVHTTTVSRMVHGLKRPDPANVARVADALRRDVREVSGWVRQARTAPIEYTVPSEVNLLTRREQDAISELIRAIAATRGPVMGDALQPASMTTDQPGWGYNETTGEVVPPPPGTPAGPAGPWGTKPTDFALPRGELPKKGSRKRRSGTHAPRDTGGRTT